MCLLVFGGAIIDQLILYAGGTIGLKMPFTFLAACIVAIWIICNEIISILENVADMGVAVPGFLKPIVNKLTKQTEIDINSVKKKEHIIRKNT